MRKAVQLACNENAITCVYECKSIVNNRIKGTVATSLLEAGRYDTATSLRSGDLNVNSIKSSKPLDEKKGLNSKLHFWHQKLMPMALL